MIHHTIGETDRATTDRLCRHPAPRPMRLLHTALRARAQAPRTTAPSTLPHPAPSGARVSVHDEYVFVHDEYDDRVHDKYDERVRACHLHY
jgi:hypothetical protein